MNLLLAEGSTLQQLKDAQESISSTFANSVASNQSGMASITGGTQPWNPGLVFGLTLVILIFAVFVLLIIRSLLKEKCDASDILRLTTMPMVITAAVILVVLGYSNNQMTPVIGLLGTMVGYILGSQKSQPQAGDSSSNAAKPAAPLTQGEIKAPDKAPNS